MDRRQAREALRAAGVAEGYYRIEGVHDPTPTPPDFLFLRRSGDGGWEVGAYERGAHQVIARYGNESTACAHLLKLLL
ncbi:hypothetical protein ACFVIM_26805 [Streptomyces sp. NPDC057638]|uniref:hypothetical protein n=1 Tax=Streptomyces sp. NPDC057638 TaxID=3346190 RepID=UPI00367F1265